MKLYHLTVLTLSLFVATGPVCANTLSKTVESLNPLSSTAYAAEEDSIQSKLDQGAKLYRNGKWSEAILLWNEVLKLDPQNKKALRYIQRAEKKLSGETKESPTETSLAQTKEKTPAAFLREGILLYREGKYTPAIKKWNKVLVKDPNNEKAKRYIERALKKQAELGLVDTPPTIVEAEEQPTKITEAPPILPKKMVTTAIKPKIKPEIKPKVITPKKEVALTPKQKGKKLLEQGKKLYRKENYQEAINKWEQAVQIDPMNLAAKRYIKRAKEKLGQDIKEEVLPKTVSTPKKVVTPEPQKIVTLPTVTPAPIAKETRTVLPDIAGPEATIKSISSPQVVKGEVHDYGTLALEDLIHLGLSNHGPSKVGREEIKLSKMRLIEARRARYPGVNLKNAITEGVSTDEDFEGLEFTAEFQLPIMTGGRLKNSIRQAEANVAVSIKNYEKTRSDFIAELEQSYFALSNAKKVFRDRIVLLKEATASQTLIRKQFELGLARQLDLLNIENQFNDINFQVTSGEKDLELAYLTLKQLMNLHENEAFDIEEVKTYTLLDIDYEKTLALALQRRSDIRLAELQVLFNKYAVEVAKAQNRFRVEMNASIGLNDQFFVESENLSLETEFFVGIRATKPLGMHTIDNNFIVQDRVPSAGQTTSSQFGSNEMTLQLFNNASKTGITEAKIQYMRAKGEYKNAIKTTKFEVRQNFFEYQKALAQLQGAVTRLSLGEEEVKILKAQAQLNQAQLLDVLRAVVRKYDARGNLAQSVTSYYTAISNLNKAIGITGYYNPVTGVVSEELHAQLFKPINKPRYKVFTQLTKDKIGEDILNYPPQEITAENLLAKERKEELAFNNNWKILAPFRVIPEAANALTPAETRDGFLNSIDLAPEKPLPPFKPWQFFRWPILGLFEYETILDPVEAQPEGHKKNMAQEPFIQQESKLSNPKKKTPQRIIPSYGSINKNTKALKISSINVVEGSETVQVIFNKEGFINVASYPMANPSRILFVLESSVAIGPQVSSVELENSLIKSIRLRKKGADINAFIIDLDQNRQYQITDKTNQLVVAIEK